MRIFIALVGSALLAATATGQTPTQTLGDRVTESVTQLNVINDQIGALDKDGHSLRTRLDQYDVDKKKYEADLAQHQSTIQPVMERFTAWKAADASIAPRHTDLQARLAAHNSRCGGVTSSNKSFVDKCNQEADDLNAERDRLAAEEAQHDRDRVSVKSGLESWQSEGKQLEDRRTALDIQYTDIKAKGKEFFTKRDPLAVQFNTILIIVQQNIKEYKECKAGKTPASCGTATWNNKELTPEDLDKLSKVARAYVSKDDENKGGN